MRKPTFSIVIPALNEEQFLPRLLDSLSRQTRKDFEVVVVDGSSKDRTVEVAYQFKRNIPRLTVDTVKKPGLPKQRNRGAELSCGEWLVFADADTIFLPYFIERISVFIREHKPRLFTTWFRSDSEDPKDAVYTLFANVYIEATLLLKKQQTFGPLTVVHRDAFNLVHGYDEAHAFHEDVDFGQRLRRAGVPLEILRETLYVWSLRRFRKQGVLKVLNQYILSFFPILFFNRSVTYMPGYVMGGHLYGKKVVKRSVLRGYEKKLKALIKELFA